MKINFNDYTYFDGFRDELNVQPGTQEYNNAIESYRFDADKFNSLISNRQYSDAADYAARFHFNDPAKQKQHESNIINLRRNGRILGGIYSKIKDDDTLQKITFADNVFVDGGLEKIGKNAYTDELEKYKSVIGSEFKHNAFSEPTMTKEATSLAITFQPAKNEFLGIDWLVPDNENTIDNFYLDSGLTKQDLDAAGVEIINKDGKTTLKFDKSNPLANKILYYTPTDDSTHKVGDIPVLTLNGNVAPKVEGFDSNGNKLNGAASIKNFKQLIQDAINTKAEYFEETNLEYKDYSSTAAPMLSDEIYSLKQALASGEITEQQYNAQARAMAPHIFSAIYSLGSADYEMYTNNYNDENSDELLVPADTEQRGELVNLISNYKPTDIDVSAMVSNGKIGALITLEAKGQKEKASFIERNILDKNKGRRIQIFVPGLLQEEAQARINRDTSTRAVQEINSMIDWGYDYKLRDGSVLSVGNDGRFYKNKIAQDKESTIRDINEDMIMEEGISNLKFQFMNPDGNITDNLRYEQMARLFSMNAVQDIYKDIRLNVNPKTAEVSISDMHGNVYNPDDIFNDNINRESTQYEIYDRFSKIYQLYNELMNELTIYK